jgi:hypothetical protein
MNRTNLLDYAFRTWRIKLMIMPGYAGFLISAGKPKIYPGIETHSVTRFMPRL